MKLPLMMPEYLCGECGIELLLGRLETEKRASSKSVTASCYTPQCPQKGVVFEIPLPVAPIINRPTEGSVDA